MSKKIIGSTVQLAGTDNIISGFGQSTNAPLDRSQPLFQHRCCGIHDASINISRHVEIEQVCTMLRIVEGISRCLIDRHGSRFGRWVRLIPSVEYQGCYFHKATSIGGDKDLSSISPILITA